jgi:hypothetical protein
MSAIEQDPVEFFVDVLDLFIDPIHHRHELVLSNKLFVNRHLNRIDAAIKLHMPFVRPSKNTTTDTGST